MVGADAPIAAFTVLPFANAPTFITEVCVQDATEAARLAFEFLILTGGKNQPGLTRRRGMSST